MLLLLFGLVSADIYHWEPVTRTLTIESTGDTVYDVRDEDFKSQHARHLKITGTATRIGDGLMRNHYGLISVELNQIETFIQNAFRGCTSLMHLRIPDSCYNIYNYAFYGTNISRVVLPNGWKSIGIYSFADSGLKELIIKEPAEGWFVERFAFDAEGLQRVIYCGNSSLSMNIDFEIFSTILPEIFVPNDYDFKNFLGYYHYTQTDVSKYCNNINDNWYDDKPIKVKVVSEEILESIGTNKSLVVISVICAVLLVVSAIALLIVLFIKECL